MSLCSKTVYYTDGSSRVVEFEKPDGMHPDCRSVWKLALTVSESTGKTVSTICSTFTYAGLPLDTETYTRDEIITMPGEE